MKEKTKMKRKKAYKHQEIYNAGYITGEGKGFIMGAAIGLVVIILAITYIIIISGFWGDTADNINTRVLGTILCNEKGMDYGNRIIIQKEINGKIAGRIPKIYCKAADSEQQLIDGVVVTITNLNKTRQ